MRYVRDEYGLRGPYDDPSSIDILVMGGSTTDERFVDEGKTWVDHLRHRFAAAGFPLQVVNAGIDGHSTFGHIWSFDMWFPLIPDLRARYVLCYVGINDVAASEANRYDVMRSGDWQRRIRYYLVNNSAFYHLYRTIRGNIRARDAHLVHGGNPVLDAEWSELPQRPKLNEARLRIEDKLDSFAGRVRVLSEKIRTFGAEPIFVTQPRGDYRMRDGGILGQAMGDGTVDIGGYVENRLYALKLMEACEAVGGICIDLAGGFSFENGNLYDSIHTTPQGSERVGKAIFEQLKKHQITSR